MIEVATSTAFLYRDFGGARTPAVILTRKEYLVMLVNM
jgi:hypothetical protein